MPRIEKAGMTREQILEFLAERQQHWVNRDPSGLASSHAEDGVVHSPIFGTVTGRHAIEQSYRDLFKVFNDWTLEGDDRIIEGNRVAQLFSVQATHTSDLFGVPATGRKFEIRGVLVFDLEGGKIARERRMYDFTGLLLQLGVLKAKPGRH